MIVELFSLAITVERYEPILVEIVVLERGWVNFSANFRGKGASPTKIFGIRKLESLSYRTVKKMPKMSTS